MKYECFDDPLELLLYRKVPLQNDERQLIDMTQMRIEQVEVFFGSGAHASINFPQ